MAENEQQTLILTDANILIDYVSSGVERDKMYSLAWI